MRLILFYELIFRSSDFYLHGHSLIQWTWMCFFFFLLLAIDIIPVVINYTLELGQNWALLVNCTVRTGFPLNIQCVIFATRGLSNKQ